MGFGGGGGLYQFLQFGVMGAVLQGVWCLRRLDWVSPNFTPFLVFKGLLNPS